MRGFQTLFLEKASFLFIIISKEQYEYFIRKYYRCHKMRWFRNKIVQ